MKTPAPGLGWYLFGAALAARVAWVVYRWITHGPTFEYPDEELHWELASNLVHHYSLVTDDGRLAARMPLYPLFLALLAGSGQIGILLARVAQAALGAVSVAVACRLGRAAFGPRAGLIAGVLVACDPFGIFFANLLLSEVLFTLLALGLIACAWGMMASPRPSWAVTVGVALLGPAAILTRPSAAGLVPLIWLLVGGLAADRRQTLRRLWVCPAALALLLLPWGLRNKVALGSFAWLSTNGGVTLYDGQGPQADGSSNQAFLAQMPELRGMNEVAIDRTLGRLAIEQMRKDPLRVVRLAGTKFLRTWSLTPNVAEYRHRAAALVGAAFTFAVVVGGAAGLVRAVTSRPHRPRPGLLSFHALIWLPVIYFTLLHCLYVGSVRYRVPLMPFIALAAAAACARTPTEPQAEGIGRPD